MNGVKGLFASRTVWGILFSGLALVLNRWGFTVGPEEQATAINVILDIMAGVGGLYALYGRVVATKKIG